MRVFTPRRSCARTPSDPFRLPQAPSVLLDHAASLVAFALLIASWAVVYVTILPADPIPGHIHRQPALLASTN